MIVAKAEKDDIGLLVGGLVSSVKSIRDQLRLVLPQISELAVRVELPNGGSLWLMAEEAQGYLDGLVRVLEVMKKGVSTS